MPRRTTTSPFTLAFGARLRSLRQELGLSLDQLSKKTDISKGHLSSIECGFAVITVETLTRIAAGLDICPAMLLAFPDDEHGKTIEIMRQLPTTRLKRLRRIMRKWIAENDASS